MAPWVFDDLPAALGEGLQTAGFLRSLKAGETLYAEGSQSDSAYVVLQGLVRLSKVSPNGNRALVAVRGRGEFLGQYSALDSKPRIATARALTPAQLWCVLRPNFIEALNDNPDLTQLVLVGLCGQVRDTASHIVELLDEDVTVLIARRLVQLATEPKLGPLRRRSSDNTVVIESVSQSDLAGWAGVSQRSAGLALHDFRSEGLIATSRLRVEVLDLEGLRRRAAPILSSTRV